MLKKLFKVLRYRFFRLLAHQFPKKWADVLFKHYFGRKLNWKSPRDINEKINWLKFNHDTSHWSELSDKYEVRKYVEEKGFADALPRLYGKWDSADDIDWDSLPQQFVMKVNNGSGDIVLCDDKNKLDKKAVETKMRKLLRLRFGDRFAEPHYNSIKPCIIAEEYLDSEDQSVKSSSLIDYKIWVLNGKPEFIFVYLNRKQGSFYMNIFDTDWNPHPEYAVETPKALIMREPIPRPASFDQMLEMAASLAGNEPQVRVDLYEVGGKPYFGELTFTAAGGFLNHFSQEILDIMGDKCKIEFP